MILLDTCALLWLAQDQKKMSRLTLQKISDASVVSVSAITGFEIGLKYRAGKLHLPAPPWEWFEGIISHHDISVLDLGIGICIKASELPPIHKDPCDRFIIATALLNSIPIVTADERFADYGVKVLM